MLWHAGAALNIRSKDYLLRGDVLKAETIFDNNVYWPLLKLWQLPAI